MTRFASTQWSLVRRAGSGKHDARAALDDLCRTYRPPVLAYIRAHAGVEDAEDLTQAFFAEFVATALHAGAEPGRGRFRTYLLTSLKHFLINSTQAARAIKRGGAAHMTSLEAPGTDDGLRAAERDSPDRVFERRWALTVIDAALRALRAEAQAAGKLDVFSRLREFLIEPPAEADYAVLAREMNVRPNTLAATVHRMRRRLREHVLAQLAHTTHARADLDAELRDLRAALAGVME